MTVSRMTFSDRLSRLRPTAFVLYAGLAGFTAYFSMYAFRKPFTAATFADLPDWAGQIDYKVVLVIAQAVGYALSKWIGVKLIAEVGRGRRAALILGLIATSWLALVLFAVVPRPWNIAALFLNGLPLGLIWGLVFSYMEGRRVSDVLGAILCASFIVSSGVVKAAGKLLLQAGVNEFWMPAAVGGLFAPLLLIAVLGLSQIPAPDAEDERQRTRRVPMDRQQRRRFLATYWPGLIMLVVAYILFSAFRDFRDTFAAALWEALGYGDQAAVFVTSEVPVAVLSLAAMAGLVWVKRNHQALMLIHLVMAGGALLLGLSTLAFMAGGMSPFVWVLCTGAGVYIVYTPFNAVLFDRLIATTGQVANAGFLIYVADASGYVGSLGLLLYRSLATPNLDWVPFFQGAALLTSAAGVVCFGASALYFWKRTGDGVESPPVVVGNAARDLQATHEGY